MGRSRADPRTNGRLPITVELPADVRERIRDAQRQVPAGEPDARVDIGEVDGEPERFETAPGVEFAAPTADFGGATPDVDLGEGSLGSPESRRTPASSS